MLCIVLLCVQEDELTVVNEFFVDDDYNVVDPDVLPTVVNECIVDDHDVLVTVIHLCFVDGGYDVFEKVAFDNLY